MAGSGLPPFPFRGPAATPAAHSAVPGTTEGTGPCLLSFCGTAAPARHVRPDGGGGRALRAPGRLSGEAGGFTAGSAASSQPARTTRAGRGACRASPLMQSSRWNRLARAVCAAISCQKLTPGLMVRSGYSISAVQSTRLMQTRLPAAAWARQAPLTLVDIHLRFFQADATKMMQDRNLDLVDLSFTRREWNLPRRRAPSRPTPACATGSAG